MNIAEYNNINNNNNNINDTCSICQLEFTEEDKNLNKIMRLECSHKFHIDCIFSWARSNNVNHNQCPNCRNAGLQLQENRYLGRNIVKIRLTELRKLLRHKKIATSNEGKNIKKKFEAIKKQEEKIKKIKLENIEKKKIKKNQSIIEALKENSKMKNKLYRHMHYKYTLERDLSLRVSHFHIIHRQLINNN